MATSSPSDLAPLLNIFDPAVGIPLLERELREEVKFDSLGSTAIKYRGLLYDDSREVSKQHLGLTYQVVAESETFEIGERVCLIDAVPKRLMRSKNDAGILKLVVAVDG